MKKGKQLMGTLMAACLAVSCLAGCGQKQDSGQTKPAAETTAAATTAATTAAQTTAAQTEAASEAAEETGG